MRITAFVKAPAHVCCRYRLAAFRPFLEREGHRLELCSWPRSWLSWLVGLSDLADTDLLILQRRLLRPWQLHRLRRAARWLLFDFDDALFLRDSYAAKGLFSARRSAAFAATVRAADVVVAGNAFLHEQAAMWTNPDQVHTVPTCVDPTRYPLGEHRRAESVHLVWIGSSSTLRGLEQARPLLRELGRCCPGLRLEVICDRFPQFDHLSVVQRPWSEETEGADLSSADIGISWLPDDLWSRGKCGLKVIQYMAAGLPVVANPVGVQTELVQHGVNGFLAETPAQWTEVVGRLARDPALRQRMGMAGRRRVEAEYSVAAGAARWLTLLAELQARRSDVRGRRAATAH
jgi:glycosyltransferase involved in cell wall biosynthesis